MKKVPRENGAKPPILAMIGSVMAMISSGTRYACQPFRFAPANKLIAPTGARFGGCGSTRKNPPIAVRLKAGHLDGSSRCPCINLSSTLLTLLFFLGQCGRRPVGLPQHFRRAELAADPAAPDEKRVAEPVQIPHRFRRDFFLPGQRHADPLRPAAYGAADVQVDIRAASAGQDEGAQLR